MARYLAGREPVRVVGWQRPAPSGIDDVFVGMLDFGGTLAQFDCGFAAPFRTDVGVVGTTGPSGEYRAVQAWRERTTHHLASAPNEKWWPSKDRRSRRRGRRHGGRNASTIRRARQPRRLTREHRHAPRAVPIRTHGPADQSPVTAIRASWREGKSRQDDVDGLFLRRIADAVGARLILERADERCGLCGPRHGGGVIVCVITNGF